MTKLLPLILALALPRAARAAEASAEVGLSPEAVAVGQAARLEIRFRVPEGSHISPDAPLSIRVSAPPAVKIEKPRLRYADAVSVGAAPSFADRLTPTAAGEQAIEVSMSYYVCKKDLCDRRTQRATLKLEAR